MNTETASAAPTTCGYTDEDLDLCCDLPTGHDGHHSDYGITF
jgi:hypothetical protein